jgi:TM2 domain-containing membrane protein YozV
MKPEDGRKALDQAHQYYQKLTRPDRPPEADRGQKPWLAALLSLLLAGAGQIYNRQLGKGVLLFFLVYVVGGMGLLLFVLLRLIDALREHLDAVGPWLLIPWVGLYLFGVVDAWRTAAALRSGKLLVRYSLRRQGIHAALGFVPFLGQVVPAETVAADEVDQSMGEVVKKEIKARAVKWVLVRLLRLFLLGLGSILLLVGVVLGNQTLTIIGGLFLVAGVFTFLA